MDYKDRLADYLKFDIVGEYLILYIVGEYLKFDIVGEHLILYIVGD